MLNVEDICSAALRLSLDERLMVFQSLEQSFRSVAGVSDSSDDFPHEIRKLIAERMQTPLAKYVPWETVRTDVAGKLAAMHE